MLLFQRSDHEAPPKASFSTKSNIQLLSAVLLHCPISVNQLSCDPFFICLPWRNTFKQIICAPHNTSSSPKYETELHQGSRCSFNYLTIRGTTPKLRLYCRTPEEHHTSQIHSLHHFSSFDEGGKYDSWSSPAEQFKLNWDHIKMDQSLYHYPFHTPPCEHSYHFGPTLFMRHMKDIQSTTPAATLKSQCVHHIPTAASQETTSWFQQTRRLWIPAAVETTQTEKFKGQKIGLSTFIRWSIIAMHHVSRGTSP